jgi:hypothetical protein
MSRAPKLVPEPFQIALCNLNSPPQFTRTDAPSPQINMYGGTWQGQPSLWTRDAELVKRGENIALLIPDQASRNVAERLRQRWGTKTFRKQVY